MRSIIRLDPIKAKPYLPQHAIKRELDLSTLALLIDTLNNAMRFAKRTFYNANAVALPEGFGNADDAIVLQEPLRKLSVLAR